MLGTLNNQMIFIESIQQKKTGAFRNSAAPLTDNYTEGHKASKTPPEGAEYEKHPQIEHKRWH